MGCTRRMSGDCPGRCTPVPAPRAASRAQTAEAGPLGDALRVDMAGTRDPNR